MIPISKIVHHFYLDGVLDDSRQAGMFKPAHWVSFEHSAQRALEPVLGVMPVAAKAFCEWLRQQQGGKARYRLPYSNEIKAINWQTSQQAYWVANSQEQRSHDREVEASLKLRSRPTSHPKRVPRFTDPNEYFFDQPPKLRPPKKRRSLTRVVCPNCASIVSINALNLAGTTQNFCPKCEGTIWVETDDEGSIYAIEGEINLQPSLSLFSENQQAIYQGWVQKLSKPPINFTYSEAIYHACARVSADALNYNSTLDLTLDLALNTDRDLPLNLRSCL